jgi:hypothetical protein
MVKSSKTKHPGGRPKKYTPELIAKYAEALDRFSSQTPDFDTGANIFLTEFCTINGIYRQRLVEWAEESEEFADALKRAKTAQEVKISKAALVNKCNPTFAIFALKNVAEWRDKHELEHQGNPDKPIEHNHNFNPQTMTDDELNRWMAARKKN